MDDECVQIVSQASGCGGEAALVELVDQGLESLFGVALVDRLIERPPVRLLDAFALAVGQLRVQVPSPVHTTALTVRRRPALLDRLDQAGSAVGDDQHRCAEPAADQVAPERLPVLEGLAHPEHHCQQHTLASFGEPPGNLDALLGPVRPHREERRIKEQRDELYVVQVTTTELLKPLTQLRANPRRGRFRHAPQPGLLAQRLDVTHRQPAHERADHQRLQRLSPQQLRGARKQPRHERRSSLPDLRDLHR